MIDFIRMSKGSSQMVTEKRSLRGLMPPIVTLIAKFCDGLRETVLAVHRRQVYIAHSALTQ